MNKENKNITKRNENAIAFFKNTFGYVPKKSVLINWLELNPGIARLVTYVIDDSAYKNRVRDEERQGVL